MLDYLRTPENNMVIPIGYSPNQVALRAGDYEYIDPKYNHDPVTYTVNEYGQRFPVKDTKYKIGFAGCSMTFGVGVNDDEIYPHLVTEKLGEDWSYVNVGYPGSGPDIQMANITWMLNTFKLDKLCWYMSDPHRQVVVQPKRDRMKLYVPVDEHILENKKLNNKFVEINTKLDETWWHKTYYNIYTIFSLCKEKNVQLYMTCWQGEYNFKLSKMKEEFGVKELGNINGNDKARDALHPGPRSHRNFADRIYGNIK